MTLDSKQINSFLRANAGNIRKVLDFISYARHQNSEQGLRILVDSILRHPVANREFFHFLPKSYGGIRLKRPIPYSNFQDDVILVDQVIRRNKKSLLSFLDIRIAFENDLIEDDKKILVDHLSNINNSVCYSFWSMEASIYLATNFLGRSDKNSVIQSFLNKDGGISKLVALFILNRNDQSISASTFVENYKKFLYENSVSKNLLPYFNYILLNEFPDNENDAHSVLMNMLSSSIIDLYTYYSEIIIREHAGISKLNVPKAIVESAIHFMAEIGDIRAKNIIYLTNLDRDSSNIYIDYKYNNNKHTLNERASGSRKNLFIDMLKMSAITESGRFGSRSEYIKLQKAISNTKFLSFSQFVDLSTQRSINKDCESLNITSALTQIYTPKFLKDVQEIEYSRVDNTKNYNSFRNIDRLLVDRNFNDVLSGTFSGISKSLEYSLSKFEALVLLNHTDDAIAYASDMVCNNPEYIYYIPVGKIFRGRKLKHFRHINDNIDLSIVLHALYRTTSDPEVLSQLRWAVDDLLAANNILSPADLVNIHEEGSPKLIYFLDKVCVQEVLEACRGNKNQNKVYEERIKICNVLVKIDKDNSPRYLDEIRSVAAKSITEEAIKLLDTNRIYVNTRGITEWVEKEVREIFDRFISLPSFSITKDIFNEIAQISRQESDDPILNAAKIEWGFFLLHEDDLLSKIVGDVADKYFNSPQYGLNSFLSTRVRHGKITTSLRGCIEAFNLITTRGDNDLPYQDNYHWIERLPSLSSSKMKNLQVILKDFSEEFDKLVEDELKTRLYVRSKESPRGHFTDNISLIELQQIKRVLLSDSSFEAFTSGLIAILNENLEHQLESFRGYMSSTFKSMIEYLFDNLMKEIDQLGERHATLEIRDNIAEASRAMLIKLRTVENWFYLDSLSRSTKKYTLDQVIEISSLYAMETIQGFSSEIEKIISGDSLFDYPDLTLISDIIYIILENISMWSGTTEHGTVLSAKINDRSLVLTIKNNTDESRRTEYHIQRVNTIRNNIENGSYALHTPKEGGSGLYKIKSLISGISGHEFTFGFADNGTYSTTIHIPIRPRGGSA